MSQNSPAPCGCIPDVLIATIAEVAAASGDTFDSVINGLIYSGLCSWHSFGYEEVKQIDLFKLAAELDAIEGRTC